MDNTFRNAVVWVGSLVVLGVVGLFAAGATAADNTAIADPTTAPTTHDEMNPNLPTLFLIGDSTVKHGRDNGADDMWGWGHPISNYFDLKKINVQNRALGGTSSRSFLSTGLWAKILPDIKPGDFVIMQFGTNDSGSIDKPPVNDGKHLPRASIKGNGDESQDVVMPAGNTETVHSYGWYLRKFVEDAKAKGATPIVCSLIPRNGWKDGKSGRAADSYGKWAKEAAEQDAVGFVDLNAIICDRYDAEGQDKVTANYFPSAKEHTHTNKAGADLNAQCVISGLKGIKDCTLCKFLSSEADAIPVWPTSAK